MNNFFCDGRKIIEKFIEHTGWLGVVVKRSNKNWTDKSKSMWWDADPFKYDPHQYRYHFCSSGKAHEEKMIWIWLAKGNKGVYWQLIVNTDTSTHYYYYFFHLKMASQYHFFVVSSTSCKVYQSHHIGFIISSSSKQQHHPKERRWKPNFLSKFNPNEIHCWKAGWKIADGRLNCI